MDWKRVERDVNKAKKQLKLNAERPPPEVRTKVDEVSDGCVAERGTAATSCDSIKMMSLWYQSVCHENAPCIAF